MSEAELAELAADIKLNGLLVPIELYKGQIIDGRSRLAACKIAGVEPEFIDINLENVTPGEYVWSLNGLRRHLTIDQKRAVAVDLEVHLADEARARQGHGQTAPGKSLKAEMPSASKGQARDKAAQMFGIGGRGVSDAKTIKKKSPETFERIKQGELKVTQAKQEIKRQEKRTELKQKAESAAKLANGKPIECRVLLGDCIEELPKIKKARLVFADPPYNIGIDYGQGSQADSLDDQLYLDWCSQWIAEATGTLTDDGTFWLLVPDEYAEHFAAMMNDAGLTRRAWVKWYETFGANLHNNFNRTSRHLLYYVCDPKKFVFNAEAVTGPSARQAKYNDKRAIETGKLWDDVWQIPRLTGTSNERVPDVPTQLPLALVRAIVGVSSDPGDLVVDPFTGSGTTGVACKELGRKFVGIEKEERFWEIANVRIASCDVSRAAKVT